MTIVINLRDTAAVESAIKAGTFVRIDRRTALGNPFTHLDGPTLAQTKVSTRADAIECFDVWLDSDDPRAKVARDRIKDLKDKTLGCWCVPVGKAYTQHDPLVCHGQIYARRADAA